MPLQGLALPVTLWESEVLPRRVPATSPPGWTHSPPAGELVWVGAGLDQVAVYFREDAPVLGPPPSAAPAPESAEARPGCPRPGRHVLGRPARGDRARGGGRAPRALGARLGRGRSRTTPGRRSAPAGATSASRPEAPPPLLAHARRRRHFHPGPLGDGRPSLPPGTPTGARSRNSCSSGKGSSPATACAVEAFPAAMGPSTRS